MQERDFINPSSIEHEGKDNALVVEGGVRLRGVIKVQGSKNAALPLIALSLLAETPVTFSNFPTKIGDVSYNLSIAQSLGAKTLIGERKLILDGRDLIPDDIDPDISTKTTGSRYFIPILTKRFGEVTTGASGGDRIGGTDRYVFGQRTLELYEQMGIEAEDLKNGQYRFRRAKSGPSSIRLENRFVGPTVQSILSHAVGEGGRSFTVYNPSVESEVKNLVRALNKMGGEAEYDKSGDSLTIVSKPVLRGTDISVPSDINAAVSYVAAVIATDGEAGMKGIERTDKLDAFLNILYKMGVAYDYFNGDDEGGGELFVYGSDIKPVNLFADFWPASCHTDWQQVLVPLLMKANGDSLVVDNVSQNRMTGIGALGKMGGEFKLLKGGEYLTNPKFQSDGYDHAVLVRGPAKLHGAAVDAPQDIRGATSVLIAALAADAKTVINGADQIGRGLEGYQEILKSLGAKIY